MKKYMNLAIKEAQKALEDEEMPVGAVIVKNGEIISVGHNTKEKAKNCIMHAEIIAINMACEKLNDWRLNDCELYVTLEPCLMCMGAILESRIKTVYCNCINKKYHDLNVEIAKNYKINIIYDTTSQNNQIEKFFSNIRSK